MSSWFGWFTGMFWDFLISVGLANKEGTLLFLGLDNAGKTTLLNFLKTGRRQVLNPTTHATTNDVTIDRLVLRIHDVGGHAQARRLWKDQILAGVQGIVYLIDSHDPGRWEESRHELHNLLNLTDTKHTPFLILLTKIDMFEQEGRGCPSNEEVAQVFGISDLINPNPGPESSRRPMAIFPSSIVASGKKLPDGREEDMGVGFGDGFKWLSQFF